MHKFNWIWAKDWTAEDDTQPGIAYFRKELHLQEVPEGMTFSIFADSRYKLYIDGTFVCEGPQKGYGTAIFYDEVECAPFLKAGHNVIVIEVLRYPEDTMRANHSLLRLEKPVLGIRIDGLKSDAAKADLLPEDTAAEGWKAYVPRNTAFIREEDRFAPLIIHEHAKGDAALAGWKDEGYDRAGGSEGGSESWLVVRDAVIRNEKEVAAILAGRTLKKREIPLMQYDEQCFDGVRKVVSGERSKQEWEAFMSGEKTLTFAPYTESVVEISAGEERTAFLELALAGGAGAQIRILESEGYVQNVKMQVGTELLPIKGDRTDAENGHLEGYEDVYDVAGYGKDEAPEYYEPFWYRTFRYIRFSVKTGDQALKLVQLSYRETGYPLEIGTHVTTSDETHKAIWDISARTLGRCMQDTYMDCPFYEQLQYTMDARLQILYTYASAADDRLARQCIEAFKASQLENGMMNGSYPNRTENLIVSFPIHYILMLHDHMMYFGDREWTRTHMEAVHKVLGFYDGYMDPRGIVGKIGGENTKGRYWSYIDWAKEWNPTTGMPPAGLRGPITAESLLYLMGLQHAAELADFVAEGITSQVCDPAIEYRACAAEYRTRAERLRQALQKFCVAEDGMVQDGPGVAEYSQHGQVFAILTDTVSVETGRKNLLRTLEEPDKYPQCTVAMRYYLFRALEKTGLYEWTDKYWETWRQMVRDNLTTCVESEQYARSDCHAWGALALYEFPSVILGVRPSSPGYETVEISPVPGYLTHAEGVVKTPRGQVKVAWKCVGGKMELEHNIQGH